MMVNKENITEFFDKYELGLLSAEEELALNIFLMQHPEYLDAKIHLKEIKIEYPHKKKLNKPDESEFIRYVEEEMTEIEQKKFLDKIKYDILLEKELYFYKKSRVYPNHNIKYPHKDILKKKQTVFYVHFFRAAAVLAIVFLSYVMFRSSDLENEKVTKWVLSDNSNPIVNIQKINNSYSSKSAFNTVISTPTHDIGVKKATVRRKYNYKKNVKEKLNITIPDFKDPGSSEFTDVFDKNEYVFPSDSNSEKKTTIVLQEYRKNEFSSGISQESVNQANYTSIIRYCSKESIPLEEDTSDSFSGNMPHKNIKKIILHNVKNQREYIAKWWSKIK